VVVRSCVQVGYDRVIRVWRDMLTPKRNWIKITAEDCRIFVRGNTAFAYCFEKAVLDSSSQNSHPSGNEQKLFATNVFVRRGGMWFIVHHHSTLVKAPATDKQQSPNAMQLAQQINNLANGLNGAKIFNVPNLQQLRQEWQQLKQGNFLGGGAGSMDDLAAQLGALERQGGGDSKNKPRVKVLKDGKYEVSRAVMCNLWRLSGLRMECFGF
jgi:ketosteroid isomerase-like protein